MSNRAKARKEQKLRELLPYYTRDLGTVPGGASKAKQVHRYWNELSAMNAQQEQKQRAIDEEKQVKMRRAERRIGSLAASGLVARSAYTLNDKARWISTKSKPVSVSLSLAQFLETIIQKYPRQAAAARITRELTAELTAGVMSELYAVWAPPWVWSLADLLLADLYLSETSTMASALEYMKNACSMSAQEREAIIGFLDLRVSTVLNKR